jgi:hypothetical protein
MNLLQRIDILLSDEAMASGATTTGNVEKNLAKGSVDVVGGSCPKGQVYDKSKKVCVPIKNETSVVGGSYVSGDTVNIVGSGQTRVWGVKRGSILDLNRKEPVEIEMDDPTDENIIGRKGLKFNKLTGAYTPELWGENE